jgi:hypothetical protein
VGTAKYLPTAIRLLLLCRFRAPLEIAAIQGGLQD